jgi:hypothetical protein
MREVSTKVSRAKNEENTENNNKLWGTRESFARTS